MAGELEHRTELLVQPLVLWYLQLLLLLELLVDVAANAGRNVLILPPPDGGGRGWLPSPGLPEPDSTPSFGHPIHTDETTKRHTPDLQLVGAWSVLLGACYMSNMARNINLDFILEHLVCQFSHICQSSHSTIHKVYQKSIALISREHKK